MATLSSVITQTVGNSSGGVNLITAPSSSSIWTASGLTLSTTTTAAELPLEGFSASAVKFLLTGSTTSAYVDFLVPTSLAQTKLSLQWFARANVTTIGSITMSLSSYASAGNRTSNTSPTTVTLQTSIVASAATSFNTTFDTASQQFYRLTFSFPASSSNWYSIAQFVLGPGTITQGAAIADIGSLTFTSNQTGGTTTITAKGSRVGDTLNAYVRMVQSSSNGTLATFLAFTMPTGYTIDTTRLNGDNFVGLATHDTGAGTFNPAASVVAGTSTTLIVRKQGTAGNLLGTDMTTNAELHLNLRIPIAEWAGSGTVNLGAGAQVEYAATSGTWNLDSSTTVYGPGGQAIGGTLTATRSKTVTWQYPVQADDMIIIEGSRDGLYWAPLNGFSFSGGTVYPAPDSTGTEFAGVSFYSTGTTTVVSFGRFMSLANDDSPTVNWPSSNAFWRVRKAKASSPVGFGMATATASGLIPRFVNATTVTHSGSNFTSSSGSWTVDSGDQKEFSYWIIGDVMTVTFSIEDSSFSGTPAEANIAIPGGFSVATGVRTVVCIDATVAGSSTDVGRARVITGANLIVLFRRDAANWSGTNNTNMRGQISFRIA